MPKTMFTIWEEYERKRQRNPIARQTYGSDKFYSEEEILNAVDKVCSFDKICLLRKELGLKRCDYDINKVLFFCF